MPFGAIANAFGTAAQIDGQRSRDTFQYFSGKEASATQYRRQKKLMDRQMYNELHLARNMPSTVMEGLKEAGINPILAAQNFSGGHASAGSAALGSTPSGGGSISPGDVGSALSVKRQLDQQEKLQNAQIALLQEQAQTERTNQANISARTQTELNNPANVVSRTLLTDEERRARELANSMTYIEAEFFKKYPHLIHLANDAASGAAKSAAHAGDILLDAYVDKKVGEAATTKESSAKGFFERFTDYARRKRAENEAKRGNNK